MNKVFIAIAAIIVLSGCLKESENTLNCPYNECAVVASAAEVKMVEDYLAANSIVATKHCSGLYYRIETEGSGTAPQNCNAVTVSYEGKLTNGTTFDQSIQPVSFYLYQVIRGWQNGLPLIKPGGRIHLYIPPSLGYGGQQAGTIPPNSVLIFKVDLIAVR